MSFWHAFLVFSDKSCILLKFDSTERMDSLIIHYLLCSSIFDGILYATQIFCFLYFFIGLLYFPFDSWFLLKRKLGLLKITTHTFENDYSMGLYLYTEAINILCCTSYFIYDIATLMMSCSLHYMCEPRLMNFAL